jgi:pyruvate/2-oxoglutarate dehydrogenase complex dihydrolipoamide dehydrogenase (E3) component
MLPKTATILGCHAVGERAVEIVQVVAIAMAAGQRVEDWPGFLSGFRRMRA